MLEKISTFIIKKRYFIFVAALVVAIVSFFMMQQVEINEDMAEYLPDDSSMKTGMDIMAEEFPEMETLQTIRVMFDDLTTEQKDEVLKELEAIPYVDSVTYQADSKDYNKDNHTLFVVSTEYDYGSSQELSIEKALDEDFTGYSVIWNNDDDSRPKAPTWLLLVALGILLIILFVMCNSWIEPFLFIAVIGIAIIINMGTNIIMGNISGVTSSIASVLQLALSIDYSIILMNRYRQEKEKCKDNESAMQKAITHAFSSIASSSMTTVVGLLMLVFMSFKIGMDIGIVLAKGVFISVVCVLTILPGVILVCDKLIQKTAKKELHIPMGWASKFSYRFRHVLGIVFILFFAGVYFLQTQTDIVYILGTEDKVAEIFAPTNAVVMVYENKDEAAVGELTGRLEKDERVKSVMSYFTMLEKSYHFSELADEMADMGGDMALDESVIKMLYYDYFTDSSMETTMTAADFLNFISDNIAGSETFSDYIGTDMLENIDRIKKFSDADTLTKPMNAKELATFFDMDEDNIKNFFLYYYAQNGGVDTGSMTLPAFVDFIINEVVTDKTYGSMFDEAALSQMKQLAVFTDKSKMTTPYDSKGIASALGMDEAQVQQLFALYWGQQDVSGKTLTVQQVVNFIFSDNTMSAVLDASTRGQLQMAQALINSSVNGKAYSSGELAGIMGMEKSQAEQLYLLYISRHGDNSGWKLSVKEFVDFINSDILNNSDFSELFDKETADMLSVAKSIVDVVVAGKQYTATEMSRIFSGVSDDLNSDTINLVYLYAAADEADLSAQTMSIETMLDYLIDDVLNDTRFTALIGDEMRDGLYKAKETLEEGRQQLVSGKYSRMIINTDYAEESPETMVFISNLVQECSEKLSGDVYFIGNSSMAYEMQQIFDSELIFITVLTAAAIFLIVALTFKSLSIPLILVSIVQCGVYATISVITLQGQSVYFLAMLMIECILMGVTIDYGILFTNYYCESRRTLPVKEALQTAYAGSSHTILTSGLCLILITAIVGNFLPEPTSRTIVRTVSIGALCATLLILFILPGILAVCDRFIIRNKKIELNREEK